MDDQNNNPGNNQEPPSPIGPDAKLSDETAGDEDVRKKTDETDDQPQGANQAGGGQEGQDQQGGSGGGTNRRALDNISKTNKPAADLSKKGGQPINKSFGKEAGKTGKNANRLSKGAKAAKAAAIAGKTGMAAARAGAIAAAPESLGASVAAQAGLEAAVQAGAFVKQGPINYFRNKKNTIEKLPQTAQKFMWGCTGAFITVLLLLILVVPMMAFVLFFGTPGQANPPQPTSQPAQSFYFTIKKTGPATAKAADTERLIYNIQLTDTRGGADITVTDQIPPGTVYKSSSGNGQYNPSTRTVTWTLKGSQSVNLILQPTSANTNSYVFNSVSASSTFAGATEKSFSCWQTTVGKPTSKPNPPPGCQTIPTTGIVFPPNLGPCKPVRAEKSNGIPGEYCQLPPSLDGAYVYKLQTRKAQNWGSKEMIGVLYTVAQRWKQKYPLGHLTIMDITSDYHKSHFWGSTVDLVATTDGHDCVADFTPYKGGRCDFGRYNAEATVELGKMFVDTGYMHTILHNGTTKQVTIIDDTKKITTTVNKAIFDYAKSKYPTRFRQRYISSPIGVIWVRWHEDHFHLYIDRDQAYNNYKYNAGPYGTDFWGPINKAKLQDCRSVPGIGCRQTSVR